jgi:hypothetical protein
MSRILKKLVMIAALVLIVQVIFLAQPVLGQDVLARIDQAMAHLTGELGLNNPINRGTHYWRWSEQTYADSGFGCPTPGVVYDAMPNTAYLVVITYDNVEYEYRVALDGSILVWCSNGSPIYRSDTGMALIEPVQPVQPVQPILQPLQPIIELSGGSVFLPDAMWYSWVYMDGTDLLYLINEQGAQVIVKRPELPNEPPGNIPYGNLNLAISRDSRYLLEAVTLADGSTTVGLYDFATGSLTTVLQTATNEDVSLGWGSDSRSGIDGSTLIFDANSGMAAIGISTNDNPALNEWRIAIIDLASGMIITQIQETDLAFILTGGNTADFLTMIQSGSFAPRPVYFDNGNGIHVQLIRMFTGGSHTYPAFVWYPNTNTARVSAYNRTSISILASNGAALFAYRDNNAPAIPADGPFESQNAIGQGFPTATSLTVQSVYINSSMFHFSPQWVGNADKVAFVNGTTSSTTNYAIFDLKTPLEPAMQLSSVYYNIQGVSTGALAVADGVAGFDVTHIDDLTREIVWTAPPMNGNPVFVWTQPIGDGFGLGSIALNAWAYLPSESGALPQPPAIATVAPAPVPAGVIHCPGTPPSIMSAGVTGRVTYTDGSPLNVRASATVASAVLTILPEGTGFQVIGGPQCADGYTWWNVLLPGSIYGWAAEGNMDEYFIEPLP